METRHLYGDVWISMILKWFCMDLYGNFEYGMLCFCMELVWKCLYGY